MEILQPEQQVMAAALQVRAARAELLAGNVANADTPGYHGARYQVRRCAQESDGKRQHQEGSSFETVTARENLGFDNNDIDINHSSRSRMRTRSATSQR